MKKKKYVLSVDQGTTGSRAMLFDESGKIAAQAYREFKQYYPKPGWVEHDPDEIWKITQKVISQAIRKVKTKAREIVAVGITNQRETVVLWDAKTGRPLKRAIVWQDRRTSEMCGRLKKKGHETLIRKKTGLVLDPYFSATKLRWLFDHDKKLLQKAKKGGVLFGTIDSWLLFKLTAGKVHATDVTNASRTLLYDIHRKRWDEKLLRIFGVPKACMPEVKTSGAFFGETSAQGGLPAGVPIHAVLGDQQAALYGQGCYGKGEIKNTYGTGCFVVLNAGDKKPAVPHGLLITLAADQEGQSVYALEGAIFIAGAVIQWLRDGLGFFKKASQTHRMVKGMKDASGVTLIPAFVGLGSPYWRADVRGIITGLTRGVRKEEIVYAALESIAHLSADVMDAMRNDLGVGLRFLKVDGGATANPSLMQMQADLLGIPVWVSDIQESTAWGAAKLAGHKSGLWPNLKSLDGKRKYRKYSPKISTKARLERRAKWQKEIHHLLSD